MTNPSGAVPLGPWLVAHLLRLEAEDDEDLARHVTNPRFGFAHTNDSSLVSCLICSVELLMWFACQRVPSCSLLPCVWHAGMLPDGPTSDGGTWISKLTPGGLPALVRMLQVMQEPTSSAMPWCGNTAGSSGDRLCASSAGACARPPPAMTPSERSAAHAAGKGLQPSQPPGVPLAPPAAGVLKLIQNGCG